MYKTANHKICIANIAETNCVVWVGVLVYLFLTEQVVIVPHFCEQVEAGANVNYTLPLWVCYCDT